MELSKEQYMKLRDFSKQIDTILDEVKGISSEEDEDSKYWNKRMGVLADVMLKGGVVTEDEWGEIGEKQGYDRRGLGGYFAGDKCSMVKIGNDKRAITEMGAKDVKAWLNGKWDAKPTNEQMEKYRSLLEKVKLDQSNRFTDNEI